MESLLPILLVSTTLAFAAGWLLSKTLLAHLYALQMGQPDKSEPDNTGLDDSDAQIAELRLQLDNAEARDLRWKRVFRSWRKRTSHVTHQFRQQRLVIAELRDELRRRDAAAVATKQVPANTGKAPASTAVPATESSV
jgi:hypothetical protein